MKRQGKKLQGADDAIQLVEQATTPRAAELRELERWYDGTQYDHLPDWFLAVDRPLFERGPCIVYPFARSAITSHVDLVMGEGRFPSVTIGNLDPDSPFADDEGADEEERSTLNRFVIEVIRQARFESTARHALTAAMATRSSCLLFGGRNGKLFCDLVKSRWCEPVLDADGVVQRLVVEYPYTKAEQDPDGSWHLRAYLFRRVVDDQRDVWYQPLPLEKGRGRPAAIDWVEDKTKTVAHGLGFCPAVWYPFDKGCSVEGRIDGQALHEDLLDEIYAHDFTLSLRHRAVTFVGSPKWIETGVDPGYNPSEAGRMPQGIPGSRFGGDYTDKLGDNPLMGRYVIDQGGQQARKSSPDKVWQYPPGADAKLVSLPGQALDAITEHARDQRIKLAEAAAVVFLDPGDIKYAASLSGKALETLRGRQLSRCDQIRSDVEDGLVLPSVRMLLRIVATLGDALRVPGLKQSLPLLKKFAEDTDDAVPECRATWPNYFDIDHKDIEAVANTVRQDLDAGIIRRETAVRKLADWYDIEDVDAYLEELEREAKEKAAKLHDAMKAMAGNPDDEDEDDGGAGPQGPPGQRGGAFGGASGGEQPGQPGAQPGSGGGPPRRNGAAGAAAKR